MSDDKPSPQKIHEILSTPLRLGDAEQIKALEVLRERSGFIDPRVCPWCGQQSDKTQQ